MLFFFGWFFLTIGRGLFGGPKGQQRLNQMFEVPVSADLIYAITFGVFTLITTIMFLSLGSTMTLTFKSPDVDVLFPTPVSPKKLLALRVMRDTISSTLVPVLVYFVFFGRVGREMVESFQRGPGGAKDVSLLMPASILAWLLLSVCFSAASYCSTLYFGRGTDASDQAGKWARVTGGMLILGALGFVASQMYTQGLSVGPQITQHPIVATLLFPSTLAAKIATAPITGNWQAAGLSALTLIGLTVALYRIALAGVSWLYDISSTSTSKFTAQIDAAKSQDFVVQAANRARQGKVKVRETRVYRWSPKGPWALVWKEAIVFGRTQKWMWLSMALMSVAFIVMIAQIPMRKSEAPRDILLFWIAASMIFTVTVSFGQTGFLQMLRLGDIQKPLPFSPGQVVFFELIGKCIPSALVPIAMSVSLLVVRPSMFDVAGAIALFGLGLTLLMMSINAVVILLFPEHEDPTQRSLRGLVMMLGIVVASLPPVALFAASSIYFKIPYTVSALLPTALCFGLTLIATGIAGRLYATFNPTE